MLKKYRAHSSDLDLRSYAAQKPSEFSEHRLTHTDTGHSHHAAAIAPSKRSADVNSAPTHPIRVRRVMTALRSR